MPKIDLLDVNVWVALSDENHLHHQRARHYWEAEGAAQLAFCRVTMLGMLRLLTNRKVMAGLPFTPPQAWTTYLAFRALPEVVMLAEPTDTEEQFEAWSNKANFASNRWTDGYLAAFVASTGCRMVSFDADFQHFGGLPFLHLQL